MRIRQLWTKGNGFHRRSLNLLSGPGSIDVVRPAEDVGKQSEVRRRTARPIHELGGCNRLSFVTEILRLPADSIHRAVFTYPGTERRLTPLDPDTPLPCIAVSGLTRLPHQRSRRRSLDGGEMGMVRIELRSTGRRRLGNGVWLKYGGGRLPPSASWHSLSPEVSS